MRGQLHIEKKEHNKEEKVMKNFVKRVFAVALFLTLSLMMVGCVVLRFVLFVDVAILF